MLYIKVKVMYIGMGALWLPILPAPGDPCRKLSFDKYSYQAIYVKWQIFYAMKMRQGVFPAFIIFLFFSSCKKADIPVDEPKTTPAVEVQKPDLAYNVKAATLLDMVNQIRTSGCNCGSTYMPPVAALTWNDTLALAAYQHSEDMKTNNDFSHTGSDSSDVRDRITSKGYIWRICGENIAWGQTSEQLVMNSWLKSEGHCKNIMNKSFKEMGAGRADNYWTQVFGTKR